MEAIVLTGPRRLPAPPPNPMRIIPAGDRTRVHLAVQAIRNGAVWQRATGRATLVVDGHLLGVHAGDRVRVFAQMSAPRRPHNPGQFDYASQHRVDRSLTLLRAESPECVAVVRPGTGLSLRRGIDMLRSAGERLLRKHIDPRRAGLASAVLLGCREEVTGEQTEAFVQTGTVHVLSISGVHVGILAASIFGLMRWLPVSRGTVAATVAAVVFGYTVLVDAEPPAVRAMVLVLVMCGACWLGRAAPTMNSLGAAALVVLALNPADLFRTGAQLSFLCMMTLVWFHGLPWPRGQTRSPLRHLQEQSRSWPVRSLAAAGRGVVELTLAGVAIWVVTLPLVMARFHVLSLVAISLNAILWLPMTVALWAGFGLLLLGPWIPWAATGLGWCCDRTLGLLEWSVETARRLPAAYFWVPGPEGWWLAGFYGALGWVLAFPRLRPPRRWAAAGLVGWIGLGFALPAFRSAPPALTCTFLSVGHGCATVVRLPSGLTLLYDAGGLIGPDKTAHTVACYLWSLGVTHIHAIILSHPDTDHYNGVPGLLERFSVGAVYVSPTMFVSRGRSLDALRAAISQAGVRMGELAAGHRWVGRDGCRIEVLHPPPCPAPQTLLPDQHNANSVVLAIEYQRRRILLLGDLEQSGLGHLLSQAKFEQARLRCDVLLAPHHGSPRSNPPGLGDQCLPEIVVISGGLGETIARTREGYSKQGAKVFHTGTDGSVEIRVDSSGLHAKSFLGNR